jgi:hypothetical protein
MVRRLFAIPFLTLAFLALGPGVALACGGLVADEHAEVLRRATTLAAWHDGYEHYVTGFQFAGSASSFGYIIPLPGVPSKIQKGGEWTLERLELEVSPVGEAVAALRAAPAPAGDVTVIKQVRVDALDITVVRGGGPDVAAWAEEHGFDLTPDTPVVLGRYSSAGAIFALAKYDNEDAVKRGLAEGQGTVIHFTIPTSAPWIPLRILALGKGGPEIVEADLFLLTDHVPSLSPGFWDMPGTTLRAIQPASTFLLDELRSDRGMGWMPREGMWLTALSMSTPAAAVTTDLSIDGGRPAAPPVASLPTPPAVWPWALVGIGGALFAFVLTLATPGRLRRQAA